MADFQRSAISCNFSNTFGDDVAYHTFLAAFGLPEKQKVDANGAPNESDVENWSRAFSVIAAYSRNIEGVGNWTPPTMFMDVKTIQQSMVRFMDQVTEIDMLAWMLALQNALFGEKPLIPAEERSTGDEDKDFLDQTGGEFTNSISTPPPASEANLSPSLTSR